MNMKVNRKLFNHSMNNISLPSENFYLITLIDKVELLVKSMRWI